MKERLKTQRHSQPIVSMPSNIEENTKNPDIEQRNTPEEGSVETSSRNISNLQNETENEQLASENLAATLIRKRKGLQKKLMESASEDEADEDIGMSMNNAKQRVRQKLMDDSARELMTNDLANETKVSGEAVTDDYDNETKHATVHSSLTPHGVVTPRKGLSDSLNITLKAKYLEKFKAAKDEGKAMQYKEKTDHRLAGKRAELHKTRFDDDTPMREELDREVHEKLESSLRLKSLGYDNTAKSTIPTLPTAQEAYNFFTQVWETADMEVQGQKKQPAVAELVAASDADTGGGEQPESAAEAVEQQETEEKKMTGDGEKEPLIGPEELDDYSWMPYHLARAEYTPFQEKLIKEQETYFVPSVVEASAAQKFPSNFEPRHLEDEGFYVGTRPHVSVRNLNRMENRLLKEAGRDIVMKDEETGVGQDPNAQTSTMKWFGEDGRLMALPDPVKEISCRPPFRDEEELPIITPFLRPEVFEKSALLVGGKYQLDVDVNTVNFSHHHLFSVEHVCSSQLTQLYQVYVSRLRKKASDFLTGKIKALKTAIKHIEDNIQHHSDEENQTFLNDQQRRLKDYSDEIRLSRKQRDQEMETDRTLLRNIINTWKEIKLLRKNQHYTNTPLKLLIRKEPSDKAVDEEEWEEDIADEINDMKEQAEQEYQKQLNQYQQQLNLWKEQKLLKKTARKRQTQRQKRTASRKHKSSDDKEEDSLEQQGKDEAILNEIDLPKPEKPTPVTLYDARQKILTKYNEIRRQPGEPKISVELTNGATITNTQDCPRLEVQRRNDVSKYKIFVRVIFNGKEVSKTEAKPLGQDFIVRFARIFNLEIMYWPESIKLEICESFGLTTNTLSTIYAPVPDVNVTAENGFLTDIEFTSEIRQTHTHDAVGSGVPFSLGVNINKLTELILLTSGTVSASVVWSVDQTGQVLAPSAVQANNQFYGFMRTKDPIADIGMSGLCDMEKLTKWIEESHLDPNDPSNADIMHLMRPVCGGEALVSAYRLPDHFRLEHVQDEFNFATDEDIENSRRFRMIMLRDQEVSFFKNQRIPSYDKDIPEELFMEYDKKLREEARLKEADDTDSHHIAVAKFMQKVREQVMQRYRIATHQKVYADMIREDAVPNIGVILPRLMMLAEPQRPLRPRRIERKKVASQTVQPTDVKILVNVVRAFGIPVRDRQTSSKAETVKDVSGESLVRPFIEAMFQRHVHATSVAEGPNPSWNEELCIPFRAPNNDFSPASLQTMNDCLYLNLFDEFVIDIIQDDREHSSTIHRRIERRWLGGIKIPFTTIYTNGRVDGTFRLNKPAVLLGYTYEGRLVQSDSSQFVESNNVQENTYLTLFVTMEPQLATPEPFNEKFESMETEQLLVESDKWLVEIERKFPNRSYMTTVINLEGLSIFVTRYIKPLAPPDVIKAGGDELVARYVSFIPSVSDNVVYPGLCDIWSSSSQFLQMLQGDEEEHAVLLTNYFLHCGKQAWLLIGSAIPEGDTAYVLTREENDFWLWNAQTGEHFSYRDNYCPVQSVGCLINADNVWANIQLHEKPSQLSFDLSKTSNWKPFFHKGFLNPGLPSIQPDSLVYMETNETETMRLQEKIESELKKKISEWRARYVTRWNRFCIQAFRRLLQQLEKSNGKGQQQEHTKELQQVLGSYKLCGFPLNMPYTEMKALCDAVYATGVHEYESSDVEFALAVYVHPYPNSVLSIWIYVASLIRKRS